MANEPSVSNNTSNGTSGDWNGQNDGSGIFQLVMSVVITASMVLVLFCMGCTVETRKLWGHIKRPWGIGTGLVCQFGLMPLTGYVLASILSVTLNEAVAIVLFGCCPGGAISNLIAYWVDGDMDLSIIMTLASITAALGMMPLCLYIYMSSWELSDTITGLYRTLGTSLPGLLIPIASGVFVKYRWPQVTSVIIKVGSIIGAISFIVIFIVHIFESYSYWDVKSSLLIAAAAFPLIGYLGGFLLAWLTRHSWQRCRTISLETGTQNFQLFATVLQLSFELQQFRLTVFFTTICYCFQMLNVTCIVAVYQIYKKCLGKTTAATAAATAEERPSLHLSEIQDNLHGMINVGFENEQEHTLHRKIESSFKSIQL